MFLSGRNINRLKYELKQMHGDAHFNYIDENISHEARQYYNSLPLVPTGMGALYKMNEDFKRQFNPHWDATMQYIKDSQLPNKSVDTIFSEIMLGELKVSEYVDTEAAERIKFSLFRGKTRNRKPKQAKERIHVKYQGPRCIDCGSIYCTGECDCDVRFAPMLRRKKYTMGEINLVTGETPAELSTVGRTRMIQQQHKFNRDGVYARKLAEIMKY